MILVFTWQELQEKHLAEDRDFLLSAIRKTTTRASASRRIGMTKDKFRYHFEKLFNRKGTKA